jgi:hypothetical protein
MKKTTTTTKNQTTKVCTEAVAEIKYETLYDGTLLRSSLWTKSGKSLIRQKECDQLGPFPIIRLEVKAVL